MADGCSPVVLAYRGECGSMEQTPDSAVEGRLIQGSSEGTLDICGLAVDSRAVLPIGLTLSLNGGWGISAIIARDCSIDHRGAQALATLLGLGKSAVSLLDLSGNPVGDAGAQYLARAVEQPSCKLSGLVLRGCGISDEGASSLLRAIRINSTLLLLDLDGNDAVSDRVIGEIEASVSGRQSRFVDKCHKEQQKRNTREKLRQQMRAAASGRPEERVHVAIGALNECLSNPISWSEEQMAAANDDGKTEAKQGMASPRLHAPEQRLNGRCSTETQRLERRIQELEATVAEQNRVIAEAKAKELAERRKVQTQQKLQMDSVMRTCLDSSDSLRAALIVEKETSEQLRKRLQAMSKEAVEMQHRLERAEYTARTVRKELTEAHKKEAAAMRENCTREVDEYRRSIAELTRKLESFK